MRPGGWTLPVLPMLLSLTTLSEDTLLFRSNARFVAVDVQVLSSNRPVTGLTRDDFRVLDNSQPQTMSTFGRDDQELDIILLLDVSGSTAGIQKLIRQTAAQATSQLYFRDRVGVIFFDSEPYVIAPPSWDWQKVYQQVVSRPQAREGRTSTAQSSALPGILRNRRGLEHGERS
jgi:hypothetical protein